MSTVWQLPGGCYGLVAWPLRDHREGSGPPHPGGCPTSAPQGHANELACCLALQSFKGVRASERGTWALANSCCRFKDKECPRNAVKTALCAAYKRGSPITACHHFPGEVPGPQGPSVWTDYLLRITAQSNWRNLGEKSLDLSELTTCLN